MCESVPPLEKPMCVDACTFGALTYEEREEEVPATSVEESQEKRGEMKIGLESLIKKYGYKNVMETVARMAKKS
jgi:Fe-S-cluster-containing dehydrogenase component